MYEKFGQFIDGKWQPSEKNETYDDTLFYIAENQYANFYEKIQYFKENNK